MAYSLSVADTYKRGKTDLNFFSGLLLPSVCTSPFPKYYKFLWHEFTNANSDTQRNKVIRFALGLPRGHAKTTFVKILICYCILYDVRYFILIVCANELLAQHALEDISTALSTQQIVDVYGSWRALLTRDTTTLKRGMHNGYDKILTAVGARSSLRGLNIANRRPDLIFCDDIQTRKCALSPAESSALYTWFLSTLLKARDLHSCLILFVGNMYNQDCILYHVKMHKRWRSFITSAILLDGKPLWEEYYTLEMLIDDYYHDLESGHPEIWFAEMMNIPIGGSNTLLQNNRLPDSTVSSYEEPLASFLTIDPAGYRKTSDDNVITGHSIYTGNRYEVVDLVAGVLKPNEVVLLAFDMAIKLKAHFIFIETVAYQQILKWYFEEQALLYPALDIQFRELKPGRRDKNFRILAFFNAVYAEGYYLHDSVRTKILYQALAFQLDRKDNKDDILDCCSYGMDVKSIYQAEILSYESYVRADLDAVVTGESNLVLNNSCLD